MFVTAKVWIAFVVVWSVFLLLPNILSVVPFVKVVADALSKNDSETKEISVSKVFFSLRTSMFKAIQKVYLRHLFTETEHRNVRLR